MSTPSPIPVLIIGGGSAGTLLSLELARHGVEVRTVDRRPGPVETSRAVGVHARTLEMIERIDRRLLQRFLDRGIPGKGYILHFVDGVGARREVRPGLDFTTLDSRYPFVLLHGQCDTENHIRDFMLEEYGRRTEWNTECTAVRQEGDEVVTTLVHLDRDGREEQVRCRYLVACDGIHSRVRRLLGLEQEGSDYKGTVLQNMDVFLDGFPDVVDYVHYCAGTDHFIMVCPLPGGFFRLLLSDRGESAGADVTPQQAFQRILDRHFDGVSLGELVWHSKWESWTRLTKDYREGNVFLAGDSAHVHSTTGGQGMNCCMQDASNLGWKLAYVLRGLARPELLDTYVAERRPIAEQVIWTASALHDVFMGHGQDIGDRAARMKEPGFLPKVVGRCSGIDYTYRDYLPPVPGVAELPGPAMGDRAPDVDLPGGGTLFDLTRHTGFTLLVLPGSQGEGIRDDALDPLRQRYPGLLHVHHLSTSTDLDRHYGTAMEDRMVVIRPDGYVGFCGRLPDLPRLGDWFGSFMQPGRPI